MNKLFILIFAMGAISLHIEAMGMDEATFKANCINEVTADLNSRMFGSTNKEAVAQDECNTRWAREVALKAQETVFKVKCAADQKKMPDMARGALVGSFASCDAMWNKEKEARLKRG